MDLWDVKSNDERDQWEYVPGVSVGPLRFGASEQEVLAMLGRERPDISDWAEIGPAYPHGYDPARRWARARFGQEGVTTYRWQGHRYTDEGLYCVAISALRGPQVTLDGEPLVGRVPSELDPWFEVQVKEFGRELFFTAEGNYAFEDLGLIMRVQRAGDVVLTRPIFLVRPDGDEATGMWAYVPDREWRTF
jgi:hypothetical protein